MKAMMYWADRGGNRLCLVVKTGRIWARLLDLGSLEIHKAHTQTVNLAPSVDIRPRRLAATLDTRRKQYKRLHIRHPEKDIKDAVQQLREGA